MRLIAVSARLATLAVGIAVVAGPVVVVTTAHAAGTSAVAATNPDTQNDPHYWEQQYPDTTCVKFDSLTTETFTVPAPPDGLE